MKWSHVVAVASVCFFVGWNLGGSMGPTWTPSPGRVATIAPKACFSEADLEQQIEHCNINLALCEGKLKFYEGSPASWGGVSRKSTPGLVSGMLASMVKARPDLKLLALDCAEFPCIARLQLVNGDREECVEFPKNFAPDLLSERVNVTLRILPVGVPGCEFGVWIADSAEVSEDVRRRVAFRIEAMGEGFAHGGAGDAIPAEHMDSGLSSGPSPPP